MIKSFYDLNPLVERFWIEIFDLAIKLYGPEKKVGFNIFEEDESPKTEKTLVN